LHSLFWDSSLGPHRSLATRVKTVPPSAGYFQGGDSRSGPAAHGPGPRILLGPPLPAIPTGQAGRLIQPSGTAFGPMSGLRTRQFATGAAPFMTFQIGGWELATR
jgi:hypothetical protein